MLNIGITKGLQAGERRYFIHANITKWSGAEVGMKRAEGYTRNYSAGVIAHLCQGRIYAARRVFK